MPIANNFGRYLAFCDQLKDSITTFEVWKLVRDGPSLGQIESGKLKSFLDQWTKLMRTDMALVAEAPEEDVGQEDLVDIGVEPTDDTPEASEQVTKKRVSYTGPPIRDLILKSLQSGPKRCRDIVNYILQVTPQESTQTRGFRMSSRDLLNRIHSLLKELAANIEAQEGKIRDLQDQVKELKDPGGKETLPMSQLGMAVSVVQHLLSEVGVGKSIYTMSLLLQMKEKPTRSLLSRVQKTIPNIIEIGQSGREMIYVIKQRGVRKAHTWIDQQNVILQNQTLPTKGEALLVIEGDSGTLTYPNGDSYKSLHRVRDLRRRAREEGYSLREVQGGTQGESPEDPPSVARVYQLQTKG